MELDLWKGIVDRDDFLDLDMLDQYALLRVGVDIADLETDIDGFLPRNAVRRIQWGPGVGDLAKRLEGPLQDAGFIVRLDEPDGYLLPGWLDRVSYYRPGNSTTAAMAWGQRSASARRSQRLDSQQRSAQRRARLRGDQHDEPDRSESALTDELSTPRDSNT